MAEEIQPTEQVNEVISMKQLLEAGVHFGHQISHWNPKIEFIREQKHTHYRFQQTVGLFKRPQFFRDVVA
jgi:small subunit ribosomal protein S2